MGGVVMKYRWTMVGLAVLLLGALAFPTVGQVIHHATTLPVSGITPGDVTSPGVL